MFNERKVAQMAAFFLGQVQGGRMSHLKLMKLLYLAEREALRSLGLHLTGDHLVSMPHGPVLSMTLNLMVGDIESHPGGWEDWITDKENHELSLRKPFDPSSLDELAPAEIDVLAAVWNQFGAMDKWKIRDWTHTYCQEWTDPHGPSFPITYRQLARAIGFDTEAAGILASQIEGEQEIDKLFATL